MVVGRLIFLCASIPLGTIIDLGWFRMCHIQHYAHPSVTILLKPWYILKKNPLMYLGEKNTDTWQYW